MAVPPPSERRGLTSSGWGTRRPSKVTYVRTPYNTPPDLASCATATQYSSDASTRRAGAGADEGGGLQARPDGPVWVPPGHVHERLAPAAAAAAEDTATAGAAARGEGSRLLVCVDSMG